MSNFIFLFVILLILKIAGLINISWWLITMPLWILPATVISIIAIILIFYFIILVSGAAFLSVAIIWSKIENKL